MRLSTRRSRSLRSIHSPRTAMPSSRAIWGARCPSWTWAAIPGGGVVLRQANPSAHIEGLEILAARAAFVPAGVYDAVTVGDLTTIAGAGAQFDALVMGGADRARAVRGAQGFHLICSKGPVPGWPHPSHHPEPSLPVPEVAKRVGPGRGPRQRPLSRRVDRAHEPSRIPSCSSRGNRPHVSSGRGQVPTRGLWQFHAYCGASHQ